MIFWGWGRQSKTAQIDGGRALVLNYTYLHLFWLLRVTWGLKYSLATATADGWAVRPLTDAEAVELDASRRVSVHWWWRWGLVIGLASIAVSITLGSLLAA